MVCPAPNNRQHCKRHHTIAQLKDEQTLSVQKLLPKTPPSPTKQPPLKPAEVRYSNAWMLVRDTVSPRSNS